MYPVVSIPLPGVIKMRTARIVIAISTKQNNIAAGTVISECIRMPATREGLGDRIALCPINPVPFPCLIDTIVTRS